MSKWIRRVYGVATLGMLWGLGAGCVSSPSEAQRKVVEQKRTWLLEADTSAVVAHPVRFGGVKIRAFRSLPPFHATSLVVKRANGEAVWDFYNAWIAPPHDLIRVQTARYLEKEGLFEGVYNMEEGTLPPLGLEGTVCELFLDCRGEQPAAVVTLRLMVLMEHSPIFEVLCSAEATARAAYVPEEGLAHAFSAALTQALEEIVRTLRAAELGVGYQVIGPPPYSLAVLPFCPSPDFSSFGYRQTRQNTAL